MNTFFRPGSDQRGMTLVELMISLVIFGVVISTAVAFMAQQNTAFQTSVKRMVALRNARYAVVSVRQDLETLGTNVPSVQPALVHGDEDVIVFAADHTTNVANDPFAVFYDPDAPSGQVAAPSGAFSIPNASESFPDTLYESVPGVRSPAEVILYWFTPDTASARSDDFLLMRRVNTGTAEIVARNLLRDGSTPFFQYERLRETSGASLLEVVPDSLLPIHHSVREHGSPADTGRSALADSIRAVRVSMAATDGEPGDRETIVVLSRLIPLPNAGLEVLSTCGSAPILGTGLAAATAVLSTGEVGAALSWSPAVDETGGEADVVRYVLWRREFGTASWGEPYVAMPAGAASYSYEDAAVSPGTAYEYALAAQDCTPTLSGLTSAGPVIIP